MTQFVAWINNPRSQDDFNLLAKEGEKISSTSAHVQTCDAQSAFLSFGSNLNTSILQQDGQIYYVSGSPLWSNEELNALSKSASPAEALAAGYKKYQAALLDQLHGNFSIVVFDIKMQTALLATDRLGTRPLRYATNGNTIFFSNNLDLIRKCKQFDATLSDQSIYHYLYFHIIPGPRTIYQHAHKLGAASLLRVSPQGIDKKVYWKPSFQQDRYHFPEARDELFRELRRAVDSGIESEKTGSFLSGGLDSSTVSGIFAQQFSGTANAFSIGFSEEGYDELDYARASAQHFGLHLNEYCVTPKDVFDTVPLVTQHFDEPFGNSSAVPTYQCALFAKRSGYDALLAGDGGDELFAGNERYAKQKVFEKYYSIPGIFRWGLLQPLFLGALSGVSFKPIHKMKRYIEQAVIPLPERMLAYNFFNITPPEEILSAAFRSNIDFNEPLNEMKAVYDSCEAENFIDKLLVLDWKFTLTDNDLRKVGVMCEAADISVHYPLLDEKILALSCQIPAQEKLKGSQLRYFYKKAMTGFLSEKTLNKPKHGFGLPFGVWLQTDPGLKEIANDSLSDFAKRDIMTASYLKKLNEQHKHQHASFFGEFIWIILILERWLQERKL